jgi:hypothetical protein
VTTALTAPGVCISAIARNEPARTSGVPESPFAAASSAISFEYAIDTARSHDFLQLFLDDKIIEDYRKGVAAFLDKRKPNWL